MGLGSCQARPRGDCANRPTPHGGDRARSAEPPRMTRVPKRADLMELSVEDGVWFLLPMEAQR
jgi:hypothetical protein